MATNPNNDLGPMTLEMIEAIRNGVEYHDDSYWRSLFHSYDDFLNAPPLKFAIAGFLQEDAVTMIGGPSGHGKTFIMLSMVRSLLEARRLFDYEPFSVAELAERVIYLVPEASIGPFFHRMKLFGLDEHVKTGRLLVRTLSAREPLTLNDPRLKEAVHGAHVFLDTAIRFMDGDESASEDAKTFAQQLFNLQCAAAKSITGAHHSPKGFTKEEYMTLENVLRGSGDIGAMLATCWGIKQIDERANRIYVQNVKPRDFEPCDAFIIEGRPHIDQHGRFKMVATPGEAGELSEYGKKAGRPARPDRDELRERARALVAEGHHTREIARQMGIAQSTVVKWVNG